MADRDVRLITKRTSVPGKIPTGTTGNELNLIRQGELASNLADKKLYSYDGANVFEFGVNSFLSLTGGTVSGNTRISGSLSANTLYSGSTDLYNIFLTAGQMSGTSVSAGSNIAVQQTGSDYKVSLVSSPFVNNFNFSGTATGNVLTATTISASTLYSGSTDLSSLFQSATGVLKQKNGSIGGASFAGNPKKYTVTFASPYPNTSFSITITGEIARTWSVESKTASGFTINANANAAFTENVYWMTGQIGESY